MSKILALFASLWHLVENKNVFVSVLTAIASVAAYYKLNVPVALIITGVAGVMTALGVTGWQTVTATTQETQLKLALLAKGISHSDVHAAYLASVGKNSAPTLKLAPRGFVRVKLLAILAGLGLAGGSMLVLTSSGCVAGKALGTCEVGVLEQQLPASGGMIATDAIAAVSSGGAALPALLVTVGAAFGPGTVKCLTQFVDTLISTYLSGGNGSDAGSGSAALVASSKYKLLIADPDKAREGLAVLHSEMRKLGIPVNTTVVP